MYDEAEKSKKESALVALILSVSDNAFARIGSLVDKTFTSDAVNLLVRHSFDTCQYAVLAKI